MRERPYAYALVKIKRHYGERDELKEFLSECNREGYEITQVLDAGNGYGVIIYTRPDTDQKI